jgi:hypothetical protein
MDSIFIESVVFDKKQNFPLFGELTLHKTPGNDLEIMELVKELIGSIKKMNNWEGKYEKGIAPGNYGYGYKIEGKKDLILESFLTKGVSIFVLRHENTYASYSCDGVDRYYKHRGDYFEQKRSLYFLDLKKGHGLLQKIDDQADYNGLISYNIISYNKGRLLYEVIELAGASEFESHDFRADIGDYTNHYCCYTTEVTRKILFNFTKLKKILLDCSVKDKRCAKTD